MIIAEIPLIIKSSSNAKMNLKISNVSKNSPNVNSFSLEFLIPSMIEYIAHAMINTK